MKPEKAIELLIKEREITIKLRDKYSLTEEVYHSEQYDIAIEAIKKQVPAKPVHDGVENQCPQCGNYVSETRENIAWVQYEVIEFDGSEVFRDKYCSECGQAIDWSVEE